MAAGSENPAEEKNQPATPFRRQEFRKSGQVAVSRELLSVVLLLAVGGMLYFMMAKIFQEFSGVTGRFFNFTTIEPLTKVQAIGMVGEGLRAWGWTVGPVLFVALVFGLFACIAQVGLHVNWEPLAPNWDRLNPVSGLQRLLSLKGAMEAFKALFKMSIVIVILWFFLQSQAPSVGMYLHKSVPEIMRITLGSVGQLFFLILLVFIGLAALDYAFQRWQLEKQMRMTRQETKEEFKLREGDPLIKQRIRSIQRRIASRRMMEAVPKADVVVTNPTHFAVALKYERLTMPAPKVTAKGAGPIAQKIKELARFNHVPIVENKPLARQMYKELDIGQFVPRDLYKAVAEVLAYVYRLKGAAQQVVNG